MRSEKNGRTLICYAGSASKASIGSKPVGSELEPHMVRMSGGSQESLDFSKILSSPTVSWSSAFSLQHTEIVVGSEFDHKGRSRSAELA
jgi:hypothetical protein